MHLDHTIIPSKDSARSAQFYAEILGVKNMGRYDHFDAVVVDEHLKLLFVNKACFEPRHYAFIATKAEYSEILARIKSTPSLHFGDSPSERSNHQVYCSDGKEGFYFDDENGHILEIITSTQAL